MRFLESSMVFITRLSLKLGLLAITLILLPLGLVLGAFYVFASLGSRFNQSRLIGSRSGFNTGLVPGVGKPPYGAHDSDRGDDVR